MGNLRAIHSSSASVKLEQARDARARAWAYVFSYWHAKQQDMPSKTAEDQLNDNAAKEVSHVEHYSDAPSSIAHQPFT